MSQQLLNIPQFVPLEQNPKNEQKKNAGNPLFQHSNFPRLKPTKKPFVAEVFEKCSTLVRKNGTFFEALSKKPATSVEEIPKKEQKKNTGNPLFQHSIFRRLNTPKKPFSCRSVREVFDSCSEKGYFFRSALEEGCKKTRRKPEKGAKKTLEILVSNIPFFGD